MGVSQNANHELVLAVEGEVELRSPTALELRHRTQAFCKPQNGLVSSVTVNLSFANGQAPRGSVKLSSVAKPSNAAQLVNGVARHVTVGKSLGDGNIEDAIHSHFLATKGTVCDQHFVLQMLGKYDYAEMMRTQLTSVSVPVLSEQMTDTDPSVSTVFNDLHKTLFFRIIFALIVRLAVNATGKPSGMKATATDTQATIRLGTLIQSGYVVLSQAALSNSVSAPSSEQAMQVRTK